MVSKFDLRLLDKLAFFDLEANMENGEDREHGRTNQYRGCAAGGGFLTLSFTG